MRNLILVDAILSKLDVSLTSETPVCFTVDSDNGHAYISLHEKVVLCDIHSGKILKTLDLLSEGLIKAGDVVVALHYRLDDMSLCIALSHGDIISWNTGGPVMQVEVIGSIAEGIAAMSWSPDGELVVLFTARDCNEPASIYLLVCHGSELEPLTDFTFCTDAFGEAEFVTVGWGKKETQFHGSEGKDAATKKEVIQHGVRTTDDGKPRIRWIGDGRFFAVSAVDDAVGARKIRVWTREGALHSTSESLSGLEQCLDWRPSGNLITSSITNKNKHQIAFFERNGLRHGEFTLPFSIDTVKVREVLWNTESNILCLWLEELNMTKTHVQLWTTKNYHWYLKQALEFHTEDTKPQHISWDQLDATVLYFFSSAGSLTKFTFDWITHANTYSGCDHEVAVVDGKKLLMTPFRVMTVPPPMCAYSLEFTSPVSSLSFCQSENKMAVLLNNGDVATYIFDNKFDLQSDELQKGVTVQAAGGTGFKINSSLPKLSATFKLPEELSSCAYSVRHLNWLSQTLLCLFRSDDSGRSSLCVLSVDEQNSTLRLENEKNVDLVTATCTSKGRLVLQYNDGSVWVYTGNEYSAYQLGNGSNLVFPVACQSIQVCTFDDQEAVVGLSQRYRLFVNDKEIATNCTSFSIHDDFLLLTTHSHTIRCINRATPLNKLSSLSDGKTHIFDETVRRVERGSRIVTCVSDGTSVILQMPRGNLEGIHPRALVLSTVRKMLDRLAYKEAFLLMHRHRINMNLICDHDRKCFLQNVSLFIEQLQSTTYLNQFITDLHEEDVTQSMYTAFYCNRLKDVPPGQVLPNKVDTVCDALISSFQHLNSDKYLLCILTAHVRKSTPQLETALQLIKSLKDINKSEEALKYLAFLVDVNELYDVALGMYDFDLVLMVAEKSQKDPKEYLLFLNHVRKLDSSYQKYTIDYHLKRYSKALSHISNCVPERFTELLSLVKEQRLYLEAMQILPSASQEREEVVLAFADYLHEKKRFEEAGVLYSQASYHQMAVSCFTESGSWQQAIISIQKLSLSSSKRLDLIQKLSEKLKLMRKYMDSATLLEVYAEQPEEAITTLIEGHLWEDSLRLIERYDRADFIDTDWKPAVEECRQQLLSDISGNLTDLLSHKERFLVVLQTNKSKADLIGEEFRDVDADMYSDTSSMTGGSAASTTHTRSTGRTSKNQKKAQRKKWSLKEGSKFEDLALLNEMKKLIERVDKLRDEVRSLLLAMVKVNQLQAATQLQEVYSNALSSAIALVPQVWSSEVVNSSAQLTGENSTVNSILESMAKLNISNSTSNATASAAELEVKRAPIISSDSTWKLSLLQKLM
ncbi:IKBKAP [Bugula neritina]|uniref:Elongator complex protein 1 n=1 Tax=Bugula neritina TaxID=10212 RepID=A0A7J7IX66_BUGNE|nr:IKBKAP [Bugula neritina]